MTEDKAFSRGDMRRALSAAIAALDGAQHTVHGHDAQFWFDSYAMLRDAVMEHFREHVHENDTSEEAILIEAITAAALSRKDLLAACKKTLEDNGRLADGDNCTLIDLKRAVAKAEGDDES